METVHQLSLDVAPHPDAAKRPNGGWLQGSVAITGDFGVTRDLQPGDELTVTMHNADGEVIASGVCEIGAIGFKPIKIDGDVIGTERLHKAKLQ